jgi:adenosylcobinamide-phosphate synthase
MSFDIFLVLPLAAVLLDLLLGDPARLPHPVRAIGALLEKMSPLVTGRGARFKGAAAVVLVAGASGGAAWLLGSLPLIGWLFRLYLAYAGLALGQLLREGRRVSGMLAAGEVERARTALAGLVSRDVSEMDEDGLRRSLAESMAENLNDAFGAPFFWLVLLGPGGLWVYKAVSTMDSMWGYRTDKWRDAGWAAARVDDVLAWLPARITAFLMLAAGWFLRLEVTAAYDHLLEDSRKTESPNAGWPMAAAAWLLGARMGGPTPYLGELKDKPLIGPEGGWKDEKLRKLVRLCLAAGLLSALLLAGYVWAVRFAG